ncbi:unnamed protein product, partial [Gulo gulo]
PPPSPPRGPRRPRSSASGFPPPASGGGERSRGPGAPTPKRAGRFRSRGPDRYSRGCRGLEEVIWLLTSPVPNGKGVSWNRLDRFVPYQESSGDPSTPQDVS